MFTNLFGNVIIFMPFGFFLPMASKYRSFLAAVFYSFTLSLCVETFQLLTKVGSFDVDDLLLNTQMKGQYEGNVRNVRRNAGKEGYTNTVRWN